MGTMITGWDRNGPSLYYIDNSGMRLKGNIFSVGSGSTYAFGVLDSYYKFDMSVDAAIELGFSNFYFLKVFSYKVKEQFITLLIEILAVVVYAEYI